MSSSRIVDDKSHHCIPFILKRLKLHNKRHKDDTNPPPFFLGLNGVQGAGKTVLVSTLSRLLTSPPYYLPTVVFSIDDVYLPFPALAQLSASHPSNPLLQHRGQPSTHDIPLLLSTLSSLRQNNPTPVPRYDKSLHSGRGDRVPESEWIVVNQPTCSSNSSPDSQIKLVLFEGWCVGFRALSEDTLASKHSAAVSALSNSPTTYHGRLAHNPLSALATINTALQSYNAVTDQLDALIHIDAADPQFVYEWRREQERGLREERGSGMTDEQVKEFVDGYYPSYELYTEGLREGVFNGMGMDGKGRQLRVVVGRDRRVVNVQEI